MTRLGDYLSKKSVNKAKIFRKTGIRKNRLSELSNQDSARPRGDEIYLIAKTIDVEPCELLNHIYEGLELKKF